MSSVRAKVPGHSKLPPYPPKYVSDHEEPSATERSGPGYDLGGRSCIELELHTRVDIVNARAYGYVEMRLVHPKYRVHLRLGLVEGVAEAGDVEAERWGADNGFDRRIFELRKRPPIVRDCEGLCQSYLRPYKR